MVNKIIKSLIREISWSAKRKAVKQVLPSRCRREGMPEYGRFTPKEIERIISYANLNIKELIPNLKDVETVGGYQNEYLGLLDLAIYRALKMENIESNYAMNLVGDTMWQVVVNNKGLIPVIDPLRKRLIKLLIKDRLIILEKRLKEMIKYPYSKPDYKIDFYRVNNKLHMDIYTCPVYDFYKQFGNEEMTLFRKTWCTFDYSAAEHAVEGGKYEREHTLSDGDNMCDMRWSISDGERQWSSRRSTTKNRSRQEIK